MSLLDKASLIVTPNAYKESKLYSVVPNTTLGDMDVVRATTATRVNSAGLIEVVPRNLFTYSEQFDNAAWTKINATVTANATTAPNGMLTADKLIATAVSGLHLALQTPAGSISGANFTTSIFVKASGLSRITLLNNQGGGGIVDYNLTTGTFTLTSGVSASIQSLDNGWYRCTMTFIPNTTGTFNLQVRLADSSGNTTFTGNAVDGVFLWGFQVEQGTTATEYFPTTTRLNIPRIDYTNGSCPSLLVEPQRTNLCTYSNTFTDASWTKSLATLTPNFGISPDGTQNSTKIVFQANAQLFKLIGTQVNSVSSIYIKGVNGETIQFFNNQTNGYTTRTLNGTWQRFVDIAVGTTFSYVAIGTLGGVTARVVEVWGAQFELGNNATSYIPTVASTVTRNADVISKTGISSLIGQTEGTIFVEANLSVNASERRLVTVSNGNEVQRIFIWTIGTALWASFNSGSVSLGNFPIGAAKIAVGYTISGANTTYSIKVNNNSLITGTTANAPNSLSAINLGSSATGLLQLNDGINSVQLYKTRLTDTEIASLTIL